MMVVSSIDLIWCVYRFQYNARAILKAICAGVGFGSKVMVDYLDVCVTVIVIFFMQGFEAFDNALEDERLEEFLKLK